MSHKPRPEPHNRRSLKGATMHELSERRRRRRANEHVRLLVRDLRAGGVLRAYAR